MLGKKKPERDKSKFLTYDKLKDYVRKQGLKTKDDYYKYLSNNKYLNVDGYNIPYNPSTFYDKNIWEGWSLFLRGEIYKKKYNGTYYSYDECKQAIKKYNFLSKTDYYNRIKEIIKLDIGIPYNPSSVYKNEWEGWIIFLNTDNYISEIKCLVDFETARTYARSLNLKFSGQWLQIDFTELPIGMTKKPNILYKDKGWISWYDFLGIDEKSKMSCGEYMIAKYLDMNNIKYLYDKSLKDCISSSKLRFDFHLPDYNICIEFDGKQHFESVEYFGGDEEFLNLKIRDRIKNDWCLVNKIILIRFNYKQSEEEIYDILDTMLNKHEFILYKNK